MEYFIVQIAQCHWHPSVILLPVLAEAAELAHTHIHQRRFMGEQLLLYLPTPKYLGFNSKHVY